MKQSNSSTLARGLFWIFAAVVVIVNGAVTFMFGSEYLNGAFGIQDALTAYIAGALYAVLFLDVAALVWLLVYMRASETTQQRTIALVAAVLSFVGSLVATSYMLATGTQGVLTSHAQGVSSAAQIFMILIVVLHAVAAVLFKLASRGETVQQASIDASTEAVAEAVAEAKKQVQKQVPELAKAMSAEMRGVILATLGFVESPDGRLHYVPDATQAELDRRRALPAPQRVEASSSPTAARLTSQDALDFVAAATDSERLTVEEVQAAVDAGRAQRDTQATSERAAQLARQAEEILEENRSRFHTTWTDEYGTIDIKSGLTRQEFNQVMAAAERAKRETGSVANFTQGRHGQSQGEK